MCCKAANLFTVFLNVVVLINRNVWNYTRRLLFENTPREVRDGFDLVLMSLFTRKRSNCN
jgi:hypothetical protein